MFTTRRHPLRGVSDWSSVIVMMMVNIALQHGVEPSQTKPSVPIHFVNKIESIVVKPGGSLNLTCAADGEPKPYVWWLDGSRFERLEPYTPGSTQTIALADIRHPCSYICVATAEFFQYKEYRVDVTIEDERTDARQRNIQPTVNVTISPKEQTVVHNGTASFTCRSSGKAAPTFRWRLNGMPVHASGDGSFSITEKAHASLFRIEPVERNRHEGTIECIVDAGDARVVETGVADSGLADPGVAETGVVLTASLKVYAENAVPTGYPTITSHPTTNSVERGRDTMVNCTASGNPKPSILWLLDSFPVDTSLPIFTILPSGSLQIRRSPESVEGKYQCVAQNAVGVAYSDPAMLYVRVVPKPGVPIQFLNKTERVVVRQGGSVNLTCAADGVPKPEVWWLDGTERMEPRSPASTHTITLTEILYPQTYTCCAMADFFQYMEYNVDVTLEGWEYSSKGVSHFNGGVTALVTVASVVQFLSFVI